jgi:formate/nitrite transporter FocA (FNT family)
VGFLVVVLGRQQLFTENTLTPILSLLHHRDVSTFLNVVRLWGLVLASNIAGTWAVGYVLAHTSIFEARVVDSFAKLSGHTIGGTFADTFVRAVFAGWIIALMMWLLPAVKGSRAQIIVVMTYSPTLCRIGRMRVPGAERSSVTLQYGSDFFLPTLLGNIVGGTTLVALLNYGQVAAELGQSAD